MVSVIGATTWGTTLSLILAKKNIPVNLLLRSEGERQKLADSPIPPCLDLTTSWGEALRRARLVILAVPSQKLKVNLALIRPHINNPTMILSAVKGLDEESGEPPSKIISRELGEGIENICVLSGPNLADEIRRGLPAATVLAGKRAYEIKEILESPAFKVEAIQDMVGVEVCGAIKNVIAIGAAMVDGLGYGDNAKAALITRGFNEIASLAMACGGRLETLLSFAGIGDLMLTCYSRQSRNYQLGFSLGRGLSLKEALEGIKGVVEGVSTAKGAIKLSQRLGIHVPIIEKVYQVLFEGVGAREAIAEALSRI